MQIIKENKNAVAAACDVLKKGGLVIYPTETVYGIGADTTNKVAIEKLNDYKKRPLGKPYSIAVTSEKMAREYVVLNDSAKNLYNEFLPGPMTIVSTGRHKLAPGVESEVGTVGVRIPDYKLVVDIVGFFGKPITATSANASYKKRPYKVSDILDNISEKQKKLIDLIIDAGTLPPNEPSTVVDTTLDDLVVLRQGGIKIKDEVEILSRSPENTQNIGKELWQKYEKYYRKRPIIFALEGPMGAGKTQFTKGLARAMGISDEVTSPTYSLLEEYSVSSLKSSVISLKHIDTWRMNNAPEELIALGFNEILRNKNAVVAIEWAERVVDVLREHSEDTIIIWVKISYLPDEASAKLGGKNENGRLISWGTL